MHEGIVKLNDKNKYKYKLKNETNRKINAKSFIIKNNKNDNVEKIHKCVCLFA